MAGSSPWKQLPPGLPAPVDDGACDHLRGREWPPLALRSTDDRTVDLRERSGRTVLFAFPRTGRPEEPSSAVWDAIPGARGCTPQTVGPEISTFYPVFPPDQNAADVLDWLRHHPDKRRA